LLGVLFDFCVGYFNVPEEEGIPRTHVAAAALADAQFD
jgi:hypothetical protein